MNSDTFLSWAGLGLLCYSHFIVALCELVPVGNVHGVCVM